MLLLNIPLIITVLSLFLEKKLVLWSLSLSKNSFLFLIFTRKNKYINKLDGNVQLPRPKGLYRSKNCNPVVNEI